MEKLEICKSRRPDWSSDPKFVLFIKSSSRPDLTYARANHPDRGFVSQLASDTLDNFRVMRALVPGPESKIMFELSTGIDIDKLFSGKMVLSKTKCKCGKPKKVLVKYVLEDPMGPNVDVYKKEVRCKNCMGVVKK